MSEDKTIRFSPKEEASMLMLERQFVMAGNEDGDVHALALSGGGIRSAAFALGVTQALVSAGALEKFHYLSTVSGGGYFGTALTWWLSQNLPMEHDAIPAGRSSGNFPFGSRQREGEVAKAQNRILNFLRLHASYLQPTRGLGLLSAAAVVLRATFLSTTVHFTLLLGIMGSLLSLAFFDPVPFPQPYRVISSYLSNPFLLAAATIVSLLAILSLSYALLTRVLRGSRSYAFRTTVQRHIGTLLGLCLLACLLGVLPFVYMILETRFELAVRQSDGWPTMLLAATSTLLGAFFGAQEGQKDAKGGERGPFARLRPIAGLLLFLYGLLLGALALADQMKGAGFGLPTFLVILGAGFLLGLGSNINYLGLHRMYRDRLMELFTPSPSAIRSGQWRTAELADGTGIHKACGAAEGRVRHPYHLINANVVLVDSQSSEYRGRGGDSFLLSPLICGSKATGWVRSNHYMNAEGGRGMSLPSAMAISGAAVNPNAGIAGRGLTRSRIGALLLSLLNLRLGYFAPNPGRRRSRVPNFIIPGLTSTIVGRGLSETSRIVELTDGGHFENLGIYELVRRRAHFILAVDGSQDINFHMNDLANAVERVRVDFGVGIQFGSEFPLEDLAPTSGSVHLPLAKRAFAVATITYPARDGESLTGTLVYIKATLFPHLPVDVTGYKNENPSFPHQSTADQFFDERQFEAYRELGYHAGWNYLETDVAQRGAPAGS